MNGSIDFVKQSIVKLEKFVEDCHYRGYEPFDGLSSWLRPVTCGNLFLERLLQQLVRQSPINLRPLLGVKPQESTKGRGYMAQGYIRMFKLTSRQQYKAKAEACLAWLSENKAPGHARHSWGNHFDFVSRTGRLPKLEPIIVWTSLIGQAFLDAFEVFGKARYLEVARDICEWIVDLPREQTGRGTCLSYVKYTQKSIHNSNMLGAAMLARTGKITGNQAYFEIAKAAMEYSCSRQLEGGSWYYGETQELRWVDNFHTGYNLDSLKCYIESTGDKAYNANLKRGFQYYKGNFFEPNGRPKYYNTRVYPVDSQCASQSIDTLADFSDYDSSSLDLAVRVARWTIENMQDDSGFFYYRQYPFIKAKTPMLHWAQATMYKALTTLLSRTM